MKNTFLKAGICTVAVFIVAFLLGMWFDSTRLEEIKSSMADTDNLWNDAKLFLQYAEKLPYVSCQSLIDKNYELGDRIYAEGLKIQQYEEANRFTPTLLLEKKRYALLDLQFWKIPLN